MYKQLYVDAYSAIEHNYNALGMPTWWENMPPRDNMELLMNWSADILPVYGSLGQLHADATTLLNRLKMVALNSGDLPKDEKIKRQVLASSTTLQVYLDGKFSRVSRLLAAIEQDRRSLKEILEVLKALIYEYKTAKQMREIESPRNDRQ